MPGSVQNATRPRVRSPSWATKHHSGRIEPAVNMLCRYISTSLRWSGEPAAPTNRASSSARMGRGYISAFLLRQRGDVANDDLGFGLSNTMMLKTHRSPEGGLHISLRDPIRQSYHERQLGAFEQQFHVRLLRQVRHVSVLPAPAKHTAMKWRWKHEALLSEVPGCRVLRSSSGVRWPLASGARG